MTLIELMIFIGVMAILTGAIASMVANVNSVNLRTAVKLEQQDIQAAAKGAFNSTATCTGNLRGLVLPDNPVNSTSSEQVDITDRILTTGLYYYREPWPGVIFRSGTPLIDATTRVGNNARITAARLANIRRYPENAYTADVYLDYVYDSGQGSLAPQKIASVFLQAEPNRALLNCRNQFSPVAGQSCYYYGVRFRVGAGSYSGHCGTNVELSSYDGPPTTSTSHIEVYNGVRESCHYDYLNGVHSPLGPGVAPTDPNRIGSCQCFTNSTYNADGLCVRPDRWNEVGATAFGNLTFHERMQNLNNISPGTWSYLGPNGTQGAPVNVIMPKYSAICMPESSAICRPPPSYVPASNPLNVVKIVEGASYDFGTYTVGGGTKGVITILNTGTAPITNLQTNQLSGPITFLDGTYPGTDGSCGSTLAPGFTCSVLLVFQPTTAGAHNVDLNFTYDYEGASQTVSTTLSGTGTDSIMLPILLGGVTE